MSEPSPPRSEPLGPEDLVMWSVDQPRQRTTMALLMLLDRQPDPERLRAVVQRAIEAVPRMRARVVEAPLDLALPRWQDDPTFDLDYHLRWIHAPGDGSLRAVIDHAALMAMQPFDPFRPPWEFTVVDGMEGGQAALILKLHHSITDGVGGVMLIGNFFDAERDAPVSAPAAEREEPAAEHADVWQLSAEAIREGLSRRVEQLRRGVSRLPALAAHPRRALREAREDLASLQRAMAPVEGPLSPLMTGRSASCRFDHLWLHLSALKSAAHAADCKLNDAFLAGCTGGLRLYHDRHGASVEVLRAAVPVSKRAAHGSSSRAGIDMAVARLPLPIDEPDAGKRMRLLRELVLEPSDPLHQNVIEEGAL